MVAMLAITVADVLGGKLLKSPIPGGIEMVGFLGVVVKTFKQTPLLKGEL